MPWPTHIVTVAGLVEDGKGNVLMAKRADLGTWEFCGGGQVELGENLEQALIREIREEGGVDVSVRCLAGVYSNIQQTSWRDGVTPVPPIVNLAFLCDYVGGEPRSSAETTDVIWCPRGEALELVTNPVLRLRLANLLSFAGQIHYHAYSSQPFREHFSRLL